MKKIAVAFVSLLIGVGVAMALDVVDMPADTVDATQQKIRIPESPEEIMFGVRLPADAGGSDDSKSLIENKIVQILGRCGAGAAGNLDVFVVEPVITELDRASSEGLVRNVSSISGELTLTARHRYSDAVFYSSTVPLNAVTKSTDADALSLLAKAIKPTDATYVRFVRNARKHAFDYGAIHPEIYVIPDIPDVVPDTVVVLVPGAAVPDNTPDVPKGPADDGVSMSPSAQHCEFYYSRPGWEAVLKSCEYDKSTRMIHFVLSVTAKIRGDLNYTYTDITRAIASDGQKYESFGIDDLHHDFPYDVPVIVQGYIKNVYSNPHTVPFIEMKFGNMELEMRNITVKDK